MVSEKLVLHGESNYESPYVFSAFVALKEKGLAFELRLHSLQSGEHRRGEYLERSLTGRVPALEHGDFWLSESSAIDEYLEDVFPPPDWPALYPARPRDRARARQVQAWLRSDLMALRAQRPTSSFLSGEPVKPLDAEGRNAAAHLLEVAFSLVPEGGGFLFGAFSIADVDLAMMLLRLIGNGDAVAAKLRAYAQAVWGRPSVREFVEHPRPPRGAR